MVMRSNHVNIICNELFHSQAYAEDMQDYLQLMGLFKDGNPFSNDYFKPVCTYVICGN